MKQGNWNIIIVFMLIGTSAALYLIQVEIFHKTEDTLFYMLQDLAFVPIQVFLVSMIINELLARRERLSMLRKLNTVISVFFSEVGVPLLRHFLRFDAVRTELCTRLLVSQQWKETEFNETVKQMRQFDYKIDLSLQNPEELKEFLAAKRQFMLGLLENPNLLEHESFTDLLLAVFHLIEELNAREELNSLPKSDYEHLCGDGRRAYMLLILEWLNYMKHLRQDYPYLFSFAVRTNPFDEHATPKISEA